MAYIFCYTGLTRGQTTDSYYTVLMKNTATVMTRLSGHVCSRPKVPDKRFFRITGSPIGPDVEIGSCTFVRTSEISGLSEPGLTNHHCTTMVTTNTRISTVRSHAVDTTPTDIAVMIIRITTRLTQVISYTHCKHFIKCISKNTHRILELYELLLWKIIL